MKKYFYLSKNVLFIATLFFSLITLAFADEVNLKANSGQYYELKSKRTKPIYQVKYIVTENTPQVVVDSIYQDMKGAEVFFESSIIENNQMKKFSFKRELAKESGFVEFKDNQLFFSHTVKGETQTAQEAFTGPLICGPATAYFIRENWEKVLKGEEVKFLYPVIERQSTIGFKFFKDGEEKYLDRDAIVVKLKPSNFLIATLVDPILFYFDKENLRILGVKGRTPIKKIDDSSLVPVDAEAVYNYQ